MLIRKNTNYKKKIDTLVIIKMHMFSSSVVSFAPFF